MAAAAGIGAIQDSECGFLLGDGLLRREILQVQIPCFRHAVAIGVGFREVVAGIEKQHGDFRQPLAQQIEHDHVLGLKAAGDARRGAAFSASRRSIAASAESASNSVGRQGHAHDFFFSASALRVAPFAQDFHDALDRFFVGVVGDAHRKERIGAENRADHLLLVRAVVERAENGDVCPTGETPSPR